jgi:hypothetical protein
MRCLPSLAGAVVAFVSSGAACHSGTCLHRGSTTTFSGSATYATGAGDAGQTLAARSMAATVYVDDLAPFQGSCVGSGGADLGENGAEFTVRVGMGCQVWAWVTAFPRHVGESAMADIESGQSCELAGGPAGPLKMVVQTGTLTMTTVSAELTMAGDLAPAEGDAGSGGYLRWTFGGNAQ